jgi:hypothetical protein
MTLTDVLTVARDAGIVLEAEGGRLRVDAPVGAITPELRQALVQHKPALLGVVWRLEEMRRLARVAPRPLPYARESAKGGPGFCFSCGEGLEHPEAYGRCGPCDVAADVFYAGEKSATQEVA